MRYPSQPRSRRPIRSWWFRASFATSVGVLALNQLEPPLLSKPAQIRVGVQQLMPGSAMDEILNALVVGLANLLDAPNRQNASLVQHGNAVGDLERALQLVRDDDDRHVQR